LHAGLRCRAPAAGRAKEIDTMNNAPNPGRNWFDGGGQAYARFRPEYPPELAAYLAGLAPDRHLAVDAGCGNGQLTRLLAAHFGAVIGIDPSADQIANAAPTPGVTYRCAPAERIPVDAASTSLVTAAQAAHWFDLPAFYREVRRIAVPGAAVALVSYGVLRLGPGLDKRFERFYREEIGPFWPPERKLVDTGYATIDFPFDEVAPPPLEIRREWRLAQLLGYVATWSAVRQAAEAGKEGILADFAHDMGEAWGDPDTARALCWPVNMRIGRA
jgi:SAM-dependent methyltransferase